MKSKDYIEKYKLDSNPKFDHSMFVFDLTNDFYSQIEWYKSIGTYTEKKFWQSVDEIEDKYESIFTKCSTPKPEKLWGYFRATVIKPTFFELFPDVKALNDKMPTMDIKTLALYVHENTSIRIRCYIDNWNDDPNSNEISGDIKRCYDEINEFEYPFHIETAIRIFIRKLKQKRGGKVKEEQEENKRWEENNRRKKSFFHNMFGGEFDPFFFAMFGNIFEKMYRNRQQMLCPTDSFNILELKHDANEDDIKKSFRELAFKYRQDKGNNKDKDKFVSVVEAKNKCIAYIKLKENAK